MTRDTGNNGPASTVQLLVFMQLESRERLEMLLAGIATVAVAVTIALVVTRVLGLRLLIKNQILIGFYRSSKLEKVSFE